MPLTRMTADMLFRNLSGSAKQQKASIHFFLHLALSLFSRLFSFAFFFALVSTNEQKSADL
jgi:hypothetical protein